MNNGYRWTEKEIYDLLDGISSLDPKAIDEQQTLSTSFVR
jgi:hypothetical protein